MKPKSENRKAMPKFILIMIAALVIGGLLGVLLVMADGDWTASLSLTVRNALCAASPWLLLADSIFSAAAVWILYRKARSRWAAITDPDDESSLEQVDALLDTALVINSVCTIISYFLIAVSFCCFDQMRPAMFLMSLAVFALCLVIMIVGQQKVVDLAKKLYPEKRGSVYDVKFAEKWYESCDEAERAMICQAAFASYKATTLTCLLLWLAMVLGAMLFEIGILPIAVVTVVWLVSTLSYSIKARKLSKRK